MSGADEAEASRLRVGPYLSGPEAEPLDPTAANAKTQLIPMVDGEPAGAGDSVADDSDADALGTEARRADARRADARGADARGADGPAAANAGVGAASPGVEPPKIDRGGSDASKVDTSKVRAVARRAAAALPALGEDSPREVPTSAKTTVERRRRAQGRVSPDETPTDETPTGERPPGETPPDATPTDATPTDATPTDEAATGVTAPDATTSDATASDATASDAPPPLVPALVPLIGQPEASGAKHSVARHAAATIPPFPIVPDPPQVHRPPAVAIPLPRRNVDDSAVDTVTDGVPVPLREDLPPAPVPKDLPVPKGLPTVPVPGDLDVWAGPSAEPNGATEILEPVAAEVVRPGPPVLDEDSWDVAPDRDRGNDLYQGKRRSTIPWVRILLIVVLVAAVGGLFAIPVALNNSSIPGAAGSDDPIVPNDSSDVPGATNEAGELVSAASSPGSRASRSAAAARASASAGATASGVPAPSPTLNTTAPVVQQPAAFVPITLQAENATVSASWQIDDQPSCGAGTAVVRTGNWDNGPPGVLTFNVTVATAGSYTLRIYFVITRNETRTAEITVNDVSVATGSFGYMCSPLTPRDVVISLKQGDNQIRFTNKKSRGPSIDRIEIRQP